MYEECLHQAEDQQEAEAQQNVSFSVLALGEGAGQNQGAPHAKSSWA
jgi:hypothetical protein